MRLIYEKLKKMNSKEMIEAFNKLQVKDRIKLLNALPNKERKSFIKKLRNQAVADFWTNEKKLIKDGKCTRDWTPEQIEAIMNISEKTGKESINGDIAYDLNGKCFYGHHMLDVATHPEYAGDWRNIQALDYDEHYYGAHKDHNTKEPTKGYYDVKTEQTIEIPIPEKGVDFKTLGYPPVRQCMFKPNREIYQIYTNGMEVKAGETLALKNLNHSESDKGELVDFERSLDVAERYKCKEFMPKYGIMTDAQLTNKFPFLSLRLEPDKSRFRANEYYQKRNVGAEKIAKLDIPSIMQDVRNQQMTEKKRLFLNLCAKEKLVFLKEIAQDMSILQCCNKMLTNVNHKITKNCNNLEIYEKSNINSTYTGYEQVNHYLYEKTDAMERGEKPKVNKELEEIKSKKWQEWMGKMKQEIKDIPKDKLPRDEWMETYRENVFGNVGVQKVLKERLSEEQWNEMEKGMKTPPKQESWKGMSMERVRKEVNQYHQDRMMMRNLTHNTMQKPKEKAAGFER